MIKLGFFHKLAAMSPPEVITERGAVREYDALFNGGKSPVFQKRVDTVQVTKIVVTLRWVIDEKLRMLRAS